MSGPPAHHRIVLDEEQMEQLEQQFPPLAGAAFAAARSEALAAGFSVMETQDAILWEVFPDGTRRAIKPVAPSIPVVQGRWIRIP